MNNSTSDSNNNNNGGNNNSDFVVAAVALVVSVVALLATFMQVLQQYYASAQGYSLCNEKVMGGWARTKTRRFRFDELRFEVQFDVPVIFVSPPTNKHGPVVDADIYYLDGSEQSQKDTNTTAKLDLRKAYHDRSRKEQIHTSDNEIAAWYVLLFAAQRMEVESREWQDDEYKDFGPPSNLFPPKPPALADHHTLTIAVQRKRKSWDTMPISVTKPYATTTMCHLIEMMAAIGVYWKEFDRKRDRYWGEGNGFMILGERLSDPGLMFSFQVNGQCTFKRNRVVPVDEIKELCFGYVPTVYREKDDQRRLKPPSDEQQNLATLLMGNSREISETLTAIGCNNNTTRIFLEEGRRTSHLFPISFEILGMLSRIFHIESSNFTFLPNPTPHSWDKRSVSLPKMLEAFFAKTQPGGGEHNSPIITRYRRHITKILNYQAEEKALDRWLLLKSLHAALDDTDEVLTARTKMQRHNGHDTEGDSDKSRDHHKPHDQPSDAEVHDSRRDLVQDVLRHHIQELLRLLNQQEDVNGDGQSYRTSGRALSPRPRVKAPIRPFDDVDEAGPDDRQKILMDVYFDHIRPAVKLNTMNANRRSSIVKSPLSINSRPQSLARESIFKNRERSPSTRGNHVEFADGKPKISVSVEETPETTYEGSLADLEVSHDDIWCTLVFRMICWLMLHNFNKKDVQLPKSELLGSRMPVYIS
ncbi:uncharacterized protein TrAtP1_002814 [Trichoderma atroviride]|nr:hypothetical protein TrAtP1_002814 [Trichoderma atroviride]